MKLKSTNLKDLYVVQRSLKNDKRGSFSRLFGEDEYSDAGRPTKVVHVNSSQSFETATLRGIHYQYPPFSETKIVACLSGSIWDVGIDLRPNSPTRFKWFGVELSPNSGESLLIPEGFGHAFITLEPNSIIVYSVSSIYSPDYESGIRFDDPLLNIEWPIKPKIVSDRDLKWGFIENRIEELNSKFQL